MRIVGGEYKGRIFRPGKKFKARPTTDIAKEALFNILENRYDFSNKDILDLFSGTGSIAYEFISRGCKSATLVETNFNHFKFIQEVIQLLAIKNAKVFKADVFRFLQKSPMKFDIIFADPPFELSNLEEVPDAVFKADILNNDGLLIVEHPKNFNFSKHQRFSEIRNYGKVNFSFFT